jgi:glycosyltransferase involved in cell wall biosynthesis
MATHLAVGAPSTRTVGDETSRVERRLPVKSLLVLAPPMEGPGGIQRYTETLTRALEDLLGRENVWQMSLPEVSAGAGEARIPWALKCRFAWQAVWEAVRQRPELIVCTHLALAPIGWLAGMLARRPYWVVVHGIEAWGVLPTWKRQGLVRADRIVATSAFNREQVIRRQRTDPERLVRLPCVLDEGLLRVAPVDECVRRWTPRGRRIILTVARLAASEQYKGHDVVLRALPQVIERAPNLTYLIVGDGDDRPRLETMAERLKLRDHVVFTGRVTDGELAACYRASEVFVLPARTVLDERDPKGEGFGIVLLEAMAFGKPVIGPNYGAPAEIVKHEEHGLLVNPEGPSGVAEALIRLLDAPEDARRMGEAACQWVRQEYSYESFCSRLRETLGEVAPAQ